MREYLRSHKLLVFQSILFLFVSLSFILPNGDLICRQSLCELRVGDWHMHDALWHISLANLGFSSWPLNNPFMSNTPLSGYNFLLAYIIHIFINLGISPFVTFFKILPVIAGGLYVFSVLYYLNYKQMDRVKSNLYAFFLYFASSFSYLATLYANGTLAGSTLRGFPVISSITPSTMFLNLQFAFSLSIMLWILILISSAPKLRNSIYLGIMYFLLLGFKFYGAVVALFIYGLSSLFWIIKNGFTKHKLIESMSVLCFSLLGLYTFYNLGSGTTSVFVFAPFALTHLFIDDPLLFYNHSLTLARYYLYENPVGLSPRLYAIELLSIMLFIVFNFGTRILSVIYVLHSLIKKSLNLDHAIFFLVTIITFLIPIFFIQEGGWYNTMQFLYYGLWFASFLTAEYCYLLYNSKFKFKYVILAVIAILTLPNILDQLRYLKAPQMLISSNELNALATLKNAKPGIVHINDPVHRNGYIPALAQKFPYYLDTDQLMVTHAPYESRLDMVNKYKGGSITTIPADYFYIYKTEWGTEDALRALSNPGFKVLYDSADIIIYERIKTIDPSLSI